MTQNRTDSKARPRTADPETAQQMLRLTALAAVLGAGLGLDVSAAVAAESAARLQKVTPSPTLSLQNKVVPSAGASRMQKVTPNPAQSLQHKATPGPGTSQVGKWDTNPAIAPKLEVPTELMTIDKAFDKQ